MDLTTTQTPIDFNSAVSQSGHDGRKTHLRLLRSFGYYILGLMQLVLCSPRGWEDLTLRNESGKSMISCYTILCVMTALTCVTGLIYPTADVTVFGVVVSSLKLFASFFAAYWFAMFLLSCVIDIFAAEPISDDQLSVFVSYSLGLSLCVRAACNLIPADLDVIYYLPIFVVITMWRGCKFLGIPGNLQFKFAIMVCLVITVFPFLLEWIIGKIL